jgi:hypothetical protein
MALLVYAAAVAGRAENLSAGRRLERNERCLAAVVAQNQLAGIAVGWHAGALRSGFR